MYAAAPCCLCFKLATEGYASTLRVALICISARAERFEVGWPIRGAAELLVPGARVRGFRSPDPHRVMRNGLNGARLPPGCVVSLRLMGVDEFAPTTFAPLHEYDGLRADLGRLGGKIEHRLHRKVQRFGDAQAPGALVHGPSIAERRHRELSSSHHNPVHSPPHGGSKLSREGA